MVTTLKSFCTAIKRYHRSKGHGIHSPFAFNFTVKVIHERTPFYAYEDIDRWHDEARRLTKRRHGVIAPGTAKLLFRVTCHFQPRAILFIGDSSGVAPLAMMRADSRVPMILCPGSSTCPAEIAMLLDRYHAGVTVDRSLDSALTAYGNAIGDNPPYIVIGNTDKETSQQLADIMLDALNKGGTVIVLDIRRIGNAWRETSRELDHGMTFTNGRTAVIAGLRHLPRQTFSLWFSER